MKCNTEQSIFFSPTKSTLKVVEAIGKGMGFTSSSNIDLTLAQDNNPMDNAGDVVIIGVPVYSGRVPALAVERLREHIKGQGRPAVLVVVYGNRAYEDALLELQNVAEELGFVPIAAAAFIGEHSFSTAELPIAPGRPDNGDLSQAQEFGIKVRQKIQQLVSLEQLPNLEVPGNFPYRDGVQPAPISPDTDEDLCTLCGDCASVCPTQVILVNDEVQTDKAECIRCGACINICATDARLWNVPKIHEINKLLHTQHAEAKVPEIFL